ncbi:MAG: hypothetical protein ETSY2_03025 [Candidatus Entotheonella gemina]|uniref:Uncharacterized protein n=1 Tax=Candidatus Entotheonella gemina TaxID=1429439 RepID=W4MGM7_9BACT|nr:MAG: hypothetical protein ETSY2_03025 [Candidatus Entotheonella gemina]
MCSGDNIPVLEPENQTDIDPIRSYQLDDQVGFILRKVS